MSHLSIAERAILVSLKISLPTLTRRDKTATEVVEHEYSGRNMGRFNKELVNRLYVVPIKTVETAARAFLYQKTAAWLDDGARMLPIAKHMEFSQQLNTYGAKFDAEADKLVGMWPAILHEAEKRLQKLFDPDQYPSQGELRDRFAFSVKYRPVPMANDLRVNLEQEQLDEIKARIAEDTLAAVRETSAEAWQRLYEKVEHMAVRLSDPKAKVYESVVTNLSELCDVLPDLNFNDDPRLTKAIELVKTLLIVPVDSLRDAPVVKENTAAAARKIANAMAGWMKT